jgi:hypothetical protein
LNGATAVKEEVTKLRSEMKKLYVSHSFNHEPTGPRWLTRLRHRMASTSKTSTCELTFGVSSRTCRGRLRTVGGFNLFTDHPYKRCSTWFRLSQKDVLKI